MNSAPAYHFHSLSLKPYPTVPVRRTILLNSFVVLSPPPRRIPSVALKVSVLSQGPYPIPSSLLSRKPETNMLLRADSHLKELVCVKRSAVVKMADSRSEKGVGRMPSHHARSLSGCSSTSILSPPDLSSMSWKGPYSTDRYRMSRLIWTETTVTLSFRWAETSRNSCSLS